MVTIPMKEAWGFGSQPTGQFPTLCLPRALPVGTFFLQSLVAIWLGQGHPCAGAHMSSEGPQIGCVCSPVLEVTACLVFAPPERT